MRLKKSVLLLTGFVMLWMMSFYTIQAAEPVNKGEVKLSKPTGLDAKLLDINQIECWFSNDGILASDPTTGQSGLFYPRGQYDRAIIYTAGLWVLGKIGGDIRSAAADYSTEFQPGSILASGTADDPSLDKYQVYKYAKGDAVDQDAVDQGCPSEVVGDQMVFCVFNDFASHQGVWQKPPIGLEVRMLAWAYNLTGALGNTIFIKFTFINKGTATLEDTYSAIFFDPDLGQSNDDMTGCDTTLGIGYVYNGDGYDDQYAVKVPALACDFFQGPIVPAPGETAVLPDGTTIADSKILDMTAYFAYINGATVSGMTDPSLQSAEGAQEAYFFVSGFRGNGEPWQDPTQGNAETNFPFAGDPVSGTGWLLTDVSTPKDVRMGLAAGPFTLLPNDPKDVVVGLVVGEGADNLSSITVMRYYDQIAQNAYDKAFNITPPPSQPKVTLAQLPGELILTWDEVSTRYSQDGYEFEGYNVYQGKSEGGPWKLISTIDKVNSITTIWDLNFSESVGTLLEMPVQFGSDKGLTHEFHIETDYIKNAPLVNGKPYYYAVTAYAYNPDAAPKILENAKMAVVAVPQAPVLDIAINAAFGDTLEVTRSGPANDGAGVFAIVMNPTQVTGDDYKVDFAMDNDGNMVWNLKNTTTGETVLKDRTNFSGDEDYLIYDGVKVVVNLPTEYEMTPDYDKGVYADYGVGYGGCDWTGSRYLTGVDWGGTTFFYGADLGYAFQGSTLEPWEYVDVRIDFWNRAHNEADPVAYPWSDVAAYNRAAGYAFNGIGKFPGAAYDISDPANPRRVNICIVENTVVDLFWDPIAGEAASQAGDGGREYFFVMNSDYSGGVGYEAIQGRSADVQWAFWTTVRGTHTIDEEWQLTMFHKLLVPVQETNAYSYSTAGYQPTQTAQTAQERLDDMNVFPNPYFGTNSDESSFFTQFVTFTNLPEECTLRVFSLSGLLVKTIEHTNKTPFERWYLLNEQDLPVGSGMYIVHITTGYGNKILKLAVINRESRYLHM